MEAISTIWAGVMQYIVPKCILSGLISMIAILFGQDLVVMQALFILILVSYFANVASGLKNGEKIGFKGMLDVIKKITLYALFLIATNQMTRISVAFDWLHLYSAAVLAFTELLVVVKELSEAGIIIPKWFVDRLSKYLETGSFTDLEGDKDKK